MKDTLLPLTHGYPEKVKVWGRNQKTPICLLSAVDQRRLSGQGQSGGGVERKQVQMVLSLSTELGGEVKEIAENVENVA